ncbi:MAG TPA: polysaccharide deacetylase family protein [Terriglobales bacterium]|nr:polysaccharide deacetylase family protein [Terriglobales bacterium]
MNSEIQVEQKPVGSRAAMNLIGRTLWHLPGRFGVARLFGPRYLLRSVLFHDVSDTESSFTRGLGGTITRKNFEAALKFITRYYTPVSLQDVLSDSDGETLPPRPVLVTFDDAYASVSDFAAPLCAKFGVPAVFFVNGECLDSRRLALDNLVCYVANVCGLDTVNAAARVASNTKDIELHSMTEVFARFLPAISFSAREVFRDSLLRLARVSEGALAEKAGLYLSSRQLRDLVAFNFEIGNHTYSHANCRSLSAEDFAGEIDKNKAVLEAASGRKVRSFSVPYGSSADLTGDLDAHLHRSGYEAVFLAENRANSARADLFRLNRVSIKTGSEGTLFSEIEILPRLRSRRDSLFGDANAERCCRGSRANAEA